MNSHISVERLRDLAREYERKASSCRAAIGKIDDPTLSEINDELGRDYADIATALRDHADIVERFSFVPDKYGGHILDKTTGHKWYPALASKALPTHTARAVLGATDAPADHPMSKLIAEANAAIDAEGGA